VRLADYTTIGLGGPARDFVRAGTTPELLDAVRAADASGEPVLILGGGSNLVVADEGFGGTVVQVATRGVHLDHGHLDHGHGLVTVAAGEDWDAVVARSVAEGLAGLECLSGIPGLAGATPIQNVGAYGQEVSQTIAQVRVYDRRSGEILNLRNEQCGFAYRTSKFKVAQPSSPPVILSVSFKLAEQPRSAPVRYPELAGALGVDVGDQVESTEVRAAVIELRQRKGMVIDAADPDTRSVGSFFVNPVLDAAALAAVEASARARCGPQTRVPRFDAGDGRVKVPAAWLIERAGFGKGYHSGDGARISAKHTLALVNSGSASTAGLMALAREIRDGVRDAFGVSLTAEPVLVGVAL
jgi:UDP-N-acetylmuramate dehydrogenase